MGKSTNRGTFIYTESVVCAKIRKGWRTVTWNTHVMRYKKKQ